MLLLLFDRQSRDAVSEDDEFDDGLSQGGALRCIACGHVITYATQRISVQGAHEHTRQNPHGFIYRFGCFARAPGCGSVGESVAEFSWFAGHSWRIAVCGACGEHLGWRFSDASGGFYGLILDRLVSDE